MATDRRLSENFQLHEFPGWEIASEPDVERLQQTVDLVLQPARDQWGPIRPTSWIYWSGGSPRTGAHADPGTVDFVPLMAGIEQVFAWVGRSIVPLGYIGRLINERDHIHMQPRLPGMEVQVLREPTEGVYVDASDVLPPGWTAPVGIPGVEVTVAALGGPGAWGWLVGLALLLSTRKG